MKITLLGTGTSQGIPVLGCACQVCRSDNLKDKRLRTSALIQSPDSTVIIDVGPDFRQQMLRTGTNKLDAAIITHEHNDHIIGLDDIRPYFFKRPGNFDIYATQKVQDDIKKRFPYAFMPLPYPGAPGIDFHLITPTDSFIINNLVFLPIMVYHGKIPVTAYRINNFLYITDASYIPDESFELMKGTEIMVINALRQEPHHSHFNLDQAIEVIKKINPRLAYLTHLSHQLPQHRELAKNLPSGIRVGYDGMELNI